MSWVVAKNGLTRSLFIVGANTYNVHVPALREEEESIVVKKKLFNLIDKIIINFKIFYK